VAAFTQWFGRSNILFAVVASIPEVRAERLVHELSAA
jgi:hypothetical protein